MKKKKIFSQAVLITILGAALVIVLIPIFWAISMSFDATTIDVVPNPPRFIPKEFSVFNYKYALEAIPIVRYYINTILLTLINTAISVFTAMACGYAFSKGKFPCKGILFLMVLAVMMMMSGMFSRNILPDGSDLMVIFVLSIATVIRHSGKHSQDLDIDPNKCQL